MVRFIKRISKKIGMKPGEIVYIGQERKEPVKITINIIDYDKTDFVQHDIERVEDCFPYRDSPSITWINVNGIHDVDILARLGNHFGIHSLALEDIANTGHRPKLEEGENYVFLILKMLQLDEDGTIKSEQVSVIFGPNYVISFQERDGDVFNPVRDRIKKTIPRIRFMGSDYLAYALLDAVVDNYFLILEGLSETIEEMEDELVSDPKRDNLNDIHMLKRELTYMRKAIWPLREVIGGLERLESELIHDYTSPYLRDLYEHAIQIIDTVETFRETVSGLLDIYLSSVSNRMNEVMKVLTIIATIFIPLGFLAGLYGMNFDTSTSPYNMPELGLRYGYPLFWLVVILTAGGLILFFKKKNWL